MYALYQIQMQLALRVEQLGRQIRTERRQSELKKNRYQLMDSVSTLSLETLIDYTFLTPLQLESLVHFANQQMPNAIIHLGNLVIDGFLLPTAVASDLTFQSNIHWSWLAKVFVRHHYCDEALLTYLTHRAITYTQHPDFVLENIFSTLQELSAAFPQVNIPEKCLLSLYDCLFHCNPKVSVCAYCILNKSTNFATEKAILQGLLREKAIRVQSVRMAMRYNVESEAISLRLLGLLEHDCSRSVREEVLRYMEVCVGRCTAPHLLLLVKEGLVYQLHEYSLTGDLPVQLLSRIKERFYQQMPHYTYEIRREYKRFDILTKVERFEDP